ncbi:MAG TPA: hypothetical protein VFB16_08145 [Bauldia sp.]|nr:hypothetical protein [Bauldia sp.]
MPLILFILVVLLILQVGFWKTLFALLGAILMIPLLIILAVAIVFFSLVFFTGGRIGPRRY